MGMAALGAEKCLNVVSENNLSLLSAQGACASKLGVFRGKKAVGGACDRGLSTKVLSLWLYTAP